MITGTTAFSFAFGIFLPHDTLAREIVGSRLNFYPFFSYALFDRDRYKLSSESFERKQNSFPSIIFFFF